MTELYKVAPPVMNLVAQASAIRCVCVWITKLNHYFIWFAFRLGSKGDHILSAISIIPEEDGEDEEDKPEEENKDYLEVPPSRPMLQSSSWCAISSIQGHKISRVSSSSTVQSYGSMGKPPTASGSEHTRLSWTNSQEFVKRVRKNREGLMWNWAPTRLFFLHQVSSQRRMFSIVLPHLGGHLT